MPYAAILVHAGPGSQSEPRLKLAAGLANQFQASLIGVAAEMYEPSAFGSEYTNVDGELVVAEARAIEGDLKMAEERFQRVARSVTAGASWRSGVAMPSDAVAREARSADLIVVGPHGKRHPGFHNHPDPGELVMRSGKPVLVAPMDLEALDAASIVVAWRDTREARRAVTDAMPFLKRASQVLVVEIGEPRAEAQMTECLQDVADYLGQHGVKASTTVRTAGKGSVAQALIEVADMQDAGLVVAGAYGHARLAEWMFGGVTKELLGGCHRAVLLSH